MEVATRENRIRSLLPVCARIFSGCERFFSEEIPKMEEELQKRLSDMFQIIKPNPIHII
jgi:hypothetical protein